MNLDKRFFITSFLFHVFVFLMLSFIPGDNKISKSFLVYGAYSKKPTKAYFKPLKAIKRDDVASSGDRAASAASKIVSNPSPKPQAPKPQPKKPAPKKPAPLKKKTPPKKPEPKKTNKKPEIKSKLVQKELQKPKTQVREEPKKQVQPVKKEPPKLQAKQEIEEIKEIEKKEEPIKIAEQKEETGEEEVLNFNLMGSSDPQLCVYQQYIQKEVERVWRPPVGVPKGTECSLSFVIDGGGNVKSFEIIKKSSILLYDLSIIKVANNFKFDECLYGKKFNIVFRQ